MDIANLEIEVVKQAMRINKFLTDANVSQDIKHLVSQGDINEAEKLADHYVTDDIAKTDQRRIQELRQQGLVKELKLKHKDSQASFSKAKSLAEASIQIPDHREIIGNTIITQDQENKFLHTREPLNHVDRWMASSVEYNFRGENTFNDFLLPLSDSMYVVKKRISWTPDDDAVINSRDEIKSIRIEVPVGFVTDFSSLPASYWDVLRPKMINIFPAIIHSYMYWTQSKPRYLADLTLKKSLEEFGSSNYLTTRIYNDAKFYGLEVWNKYAEIKGKGEDRILRKIPPDSSIRWEEFREMPGVFYK